jgi:malate dehydrogenase
MRVWSATDIDSVPSPLVVAPDDVVTPLARDRARELGIEIEVGRATTNDSPRPAAVRPRPAALPPSGALYRRGAPLAIASWARAPTRAAAHVAVVGAGHVGAMTARRVAESDLFERITLVDVVPGLAAGLALDMWHAASLGGFSTRVEGTDELADIAGADYVVVTAGRPRKPGMSRTDLTSVNAEIITDVGAAIRRHAPASRVVVVTNPLEEMTHLMQRVTEFPASRVVGMAGVLDSARFCSLVGLTGKAVPSAVHAHALGSHGPEMVIPLSQATVGATPIEDIVDSETLAAIVERTRDSGAEVVALLQTGSAYFAPAEATAKMVRAMATGTDEVITACVRSHGAYSLVDTYIGLPVRLGPAGVDEIVLLDLRPAELNALRQAAERIAARTSELG